MVSVVFHHKLIPESRLVMKLTARTFLQRQQPSLGKELVGAHHGVVSNRELEIRGRNWRITVSPHHLMMMMRMRIGMGGGIDEVIGE